MMPRLQGKVALITGGSSGLGLATAQRFVKEGAFVYITGRRQNELDIAAALIGDGVATIRGDVQNLQDLDRVYERIKRERERRERSISWLQTRASSIRSHSLMRRKKISTRPSASTCAGFSSQSRRHCLSSAMVAPSS
jgi:NAD(P)-dependent dehydrogenase (short-subunit alcohol dehydrogenase family)